MFSLYFSVHSHQRPLSGTEQIHDVFLVTLLIIVKCSSRPHLMFCLEPDPRFLLAFAGTLLHYRFITVYILPAPCLDGVFCLQPGAERGASDRHLPLQRSYPVCVRQCGRSVLVSMESSYSVLSTSAGHQNTCLIWVQAFLLVFWKFCSCVLMVTFIILHNTLHPFSEVSVDFQL